ncbi:cytochrome C oxidase subunit IV [Roseovarius sp. HI0049]|nr:cytochrome C oxidase subunit IV [Roseovarius sp. HI0049]
MADHKHGEMDIEAHEKTFEGFIRFTAWNCVLIVAVLILMALVNA